MIYGTINICTHFGCDRESAPASAADFDCYRPDCRCRSHYEKMSIWILSPQQRRVLQMIACGFSNREIAANLEISDSAVRSSINQIYKKLDSRCKIAAVFAGIRLGEISELHAYLYVEARQITNYLADNKPPNTRLPRQGHDFLIASSNENPVHYS